MLDAWGNVRSREELVGEMVRLRAQVEELRGLKGRENGERKAMRIAQSSITAMRKSDERFYVCLENMLDCVAIFSSMRDEAGEIVDFHFDFVNLAGCVDRRRKLDDQVGETLNGNLRDSWKWLFELYRKVVETGEPANAAVVDERDDGTGKRIKRDLEIRAWKLDDGVAVAWRDVTAWRLLLERERVSRRISEGVLPLCLERVNLCAIAQEVLKMNADEIEQKGLEVTVDFGARQGWVVADRARVEEMVQKVVSNAVRFTGLSGRVLLMMREVAGGRVRFEIEDTGAGMSADRLTGVFAMGSGLARMKVVAELHGGSFGAASEGVGKGAGFWLELPAVGG